VGTDSTPIARDDRRAPSALLGVALLALPGLAVFLLGFMVAPLAILIAFCAGFSAWDRSQDWVGRRA